MSDGIGPAIWVPLEESGKAAALPRLVTNSVNDRVADWRRAYVEDQMDDVWLYLVHGSAEGFANFHPSLDNRFRPRAELTHVWLRRDQRRKGAVASVWPLWRERYGNFKVIAPNEGMLAFLASRGEVPA